MQLLVSNVQFICGSLDKATKYSEITDAKCWGKFLVSNDNTINTIKDAIKKTAEEKFNKIPKTLAGFIFQPDLDKYPEQEGCVLFNASQQDRPTLFNRQGEDKTSKAGLIYRGCFVNVLINLYGWDHKGKKGISANLMGVQFFTKGTPLGTIASASDFENYGPEDDGPQNYGPENDDPKNYNGLEDQYSPLS